MGRLTIDQFINFFRFYQGQPHQNLAIAELWKAMPVSLLEQDADWIQTYRDEATDEEEEPEIYQGICTPYLMERLTGYPAEEFSKEFAQDCNRLFKDTGFYAHLDAMQMLMANMMHETCNFLYMKEIASGKAYEYRHDLGNTSQGDGPKYKGAGVLQLTGKYNYTRLSQVLGDPKVMDGVDYVAEVYPFTSARVWIEENDLLSICLSQGFDACCRKINGGWNGYEDRLAKYRICQREMR